jgi:hypothetical protein
VVPQTAANEAIREEALWATRWLVLALWVRCDPWVSIDPRQQPPIFSRRIVGQWYRKRRQTKLSGKKRCEQLVGSSWLFGSDATASCTTVPVSYNLIVCRRLSAQVREGLFVASRFTRRQSIWPEIPTFAPLRFQSNHVSNASLLDCSSLLLHTCVAPGSSRWCRCRRAFPRARSRPRAPHTTSRPIASGLTPRCTPCQSPASFQSCLLLVASKSRFTQTVSEGRGRRREKC